MKQTPLVNKKDSDQNQQRRSWTESCCLLLSYVLTGPVRQACTRRKHTCAAWILVRPARLHRPL